MNAPSWVVPLAPPIRSKMAAAAIFNFRKMSITADWIKISALNFMGRCIMAMRRWRHQMNFWRISVSISVTITDVWTKFCREHTYCTINTLERSNSHDLKIQDGGCRHLEFRKNVNNSVLNKVICTKFYGKMHHGHAEMTTWPKVKTRVTLSKEGLKDKCVDLSDYNRYLNQIWFRTQILQYQHAGMAKFTQPENPRWWLLPSWILETCQ